MKLRIFEATVLASLIGFGAACGSEDDHENNGHNADHGAEVSVEADACEHMVEGPEQAIDAAADASAAPTITATHTRYDISLTGGNGFVRVQVAEAGEMHFFFDTAVDLVVTDASDAEIAAEETIATVAECAEVDSGAAYDLGVGTYTLQLSSTQAVISLVPVPADHEHEHDE